MRALIDTNVILDVFFERQPFVEAAAALWLANEQGRFDGYISAIAPVNVFYIARKIKGREVARNLVEELLTAFRICPLDSSVLSLALTLSMEDYEDSVQVACAFASQLDAIITRDTEDFRDISLPLFSPADFIERLSSVP
jgi:predicted nucleic acid-binding protein